jgi:SSS family solute:Na+ symporter/sodium/pantothenate symporter
MLSRRRIAMLVWLLFLVYVVATLFLAWLGNKRTTSLESYAVGNRDMSPWVVGIALAASMTSTATLIINPGIVYAYGLSALLGYGVAAAFGLCLGIVLFSKGFRRYGSRGRILTVPQWLGQRYGDPRVTVFYALVNLLLIAMVVLICYAMAGLMTATLNLTDKFPGYAFEVALGGIILFVFAYIYFGGTYAHAYTNTLQGVVMLVVAAILVGSGAHLFDGDFLGKLQAIDPVLAAPVNPGSLLFRNLFEVFGANLLVGFALALQPHFIIKALYVREDRDVNRYLTIAVLAGLVFSAVMVCGLYARIDASESVTEFMARTGLGIDGVMPAYIVHSFSPVVQAVVSIALLAAGMSTLDGILVALSAILANDVFLVLRRGRTHDEAAEAALAFRVGRYSLVGFGVLAFGLSVFQHHFKTFSVAIFAQEGVYALFAAMFVPVLFGMFGRGLPKGVAVAASVIALAVHFSFRYARLSLLTAADWTNPGLTATYGLLASLALVAVWAIGRRLVPAPASA